jgi:hypothetical protein
MEMLNMWCQQCHERLGFIDVEFEGEKKTIVRPRRWSKCKKYKPGNFLTCKAIAPMLVDAILAFPEKVYSDSHEV